MEQLITTAMIGLVALVGIPLVAISIGVTASIGVRAIKALNFDSASSAKSYTDMVKQGTGLDRQ